MALSRWQIANPERVREIGRAYDERNREKRAAAARARRAANPERQRELKQAWREKHGERWNEERRARYAANPEKYRQQVRGWMLRNPEKARESFRNWARANPDKVAERRDRRRAISKGAPVIERVMRSDVIARDKRICHLCGKRVTMRQALHLDHLVPLSLGGEHTAANLAVAHATCNIRKQAKACNEQLRLVG